MEVRSRLAFFDVDGTLVDGERQMPQSLHRLLTIYRELLFPWTVATGRPFIRSYKIDGWTPVAPLVVENGCRVVSCDGEVLQYALLSEDERTWIQSVLSRLNLAVVSYVPHGRRRYLAYSAEALPPVMADLTDEHFIDLEAFFHSMRRGVGKLSFGLRENQARLAKQLPRHETVHLMKNSWDNYDAWPRSASKGKAACWVASSLRVPLSEVLVAGDDENDLELFDPEFGVRVMVGKTGPEELRRRATHTVDSPAELGEFLLSLL